LGRGSETGREKRVTPEFGERKEEKILPQILGVTFMHDDYKHIFLLGFK
jgi:hypothetical protein